MYSNTRAANSQPGRRAALPLDLVMRSSTTPPDYERFIPSVLLRAEHLFEAGMIDQAEEVVTENFDRVRLSGSPEHRIALLEFLAKVSDTRFGFERVAMMQRRTALAVAVAAQLPEIEARLRAVVEAKEPSMFRRMVA